MPLQQRVIEPVNVSRSTLPLPPGDIKPLIKNIAAATGQGLAANAAAVANVNIVNELECVTNGTLSNLIRQLSSLSRQAEELLGGIFDDASKLLSRTVGLQQRMKALSTRVESLDQSNDAPIILRDLTNQHETFSSDMSCDQQVLSKLNMPSSIAELYHNCDKPPPLSKLDPYRDDGKNSLEFYTDPTYFFELWKKEPNQLQQIPRQHFAPIVHQQSVLPTPPPPPALSPLPPPTSHPPPPPPALSPLPPPNFNPTQSPPSLAPLVSPTFHPSQPPPAPSPLPPPNFPPTPPPPALAPLPPPVAPPTPPPPAPPAPMQSATVQPTPILQMPTPAQLQQKQQQLKKTVSVQRDPRSNLLAEIKQGIILRRVELSKQRVEAEKQLNMGNDVASILARRVAMQVSDSDDNEDEDDEDNEWDLSNNH